MNACCRYWITGLKEDLKRDLLVQSPATFTAAVARAQQMEIVEMTIQRDKNKTDVGKRPPPEKKKNQSADMTKVEQVIDDIAGIRRGDHGGKGKGKNTAIEDDPRYGDFLHAMSLELATLDPSVDELVEKYKAWKLMAGLYKDLSILKAKVLKAGTIKGKEPSRSSTSSGSNSEVPEC